MNNIKEFIKHQEHGCFIFKPNSTFYNKVGIKRKRWAMILRKEVSPTIDEIGKIATYFNTSIEQLIK